MSSPKPSSPSSPSLGRAPLSATRVALADSGTPGVGQRLEFTARGERVPARWLQPTSEAGPSPLAIIIHDENEAACLPVLERYHADRVATLDMNWPLAGSRRSPKMSLRLLEALASPEESPVHALLLRQFRAQAEEEFACLVEVAQERAPSTIQGVDFILTPERERNPDGVQALFSPLGEPRHSQGVPLAQAPEKLLDFLDSLTP